MTIEKSAYILAKDLEALLKLDIDSNKTTGIDGTLEVVVINIDNHTLLVLEEFGYITLEEKKELKNENVDNIIFF